LRKLCLSNTAITDNGLSYLVGLTNLKELDIDGTDITPRAAAQLRIRLAPADVIGP
jgi:hypothetical protein